MKKIVYMTIGCLSLGLGMIGAILPIVPTVPFLLLATYCFARSSKRLHTWFLQTKLYKNNLDSYVKGKGMTIKTKIKIMVMVTFLMSVGFIMMHAVLIGRMVLLIVWAFHILYFIFGVKTISNIT